MTYTEYFATSEVPTATPQALHLSAAEAAERAVKHHRHAARLYGDGDIEQASIHAKFARRHGVAALMACDVDPDYL
jgi:hypothetical protein